MNKPLLRAVSSITERVVELDETQGVGASLKAMREARGCTLAEASTRLKYSVGQLDALESEQWSRLPQGMLLRGQVKNYARFLETDVEAILVMLDNQVGTRPAATAALPTQRASLTESELSMHTDSGSRPWGWLLVILAVLVVAGVYAIDRGWVPDSWLIFDWLKALKQ